MSVTGRVAAFALELNSRDLPERVRSIAGAAILDTLACGIGGRDERVARALREEVVAEGARPAAAIWGSRERSSPARAALVNGASAHALDFDDVNWALQGHPSVPLLPAVLATAEVSGASGEATLLAFVVGFEVEARLGQALRVADREVLHASITAVDEVAGVGASMECLLQGIESQVATKRVRHAPAHDLA